MKCELCGGNLEIENAFCPHCGQPNKFYKAHRADMANYEKRFSETAEEVTGTAKRFTAKTVWISIIAVLVALILAEVIVLLNADDINYSLEARRNAKNADKIAAELCRLEDEGKYFELADYYSRYWVRGIDNPAHEYNVVSDNADRYSRIIEAIMDIHCGNFYNNEAYDIARRVNDNLDAIYENIDNADKYPENPMYSQKHINSSLNMVDELNKYFIVYFNMPQETVESFPDLTSAKRFNILEEYFSEVIEDEK